MSDTLQEREDEMCDDCHGYTHMPYCPAYEPPETEAHQVCPDGINTISAGEHQSAARGEGDGLPRLDFHVAEDLIPQPRRSAVLLIKEESGNIVAEFPNSEQGLSDCERLIKEHNQHQSLVAERKRLREAIEVAIHNLNAGNDPRFLADYLRLTLDQKEGPQ